MATFTNPSNDGFALARAAVQDIRRDEKGADITEEARVTADCSDHRLDQARLHVFWCRYP